MLPNVFSTGLSAFAEGTCSILLLINDLTTVLLLALLLAYLDVSLLKSSLPLIEGLCTLCDGGMDEDPLESGLLLGMPLLAIDEVNLSCSSAFSGIEAMLVLTIFGLLRALWN